MTAKTVNVAIVGGGVMGREMAAAIQRWPALIDHPVRPRLTAVCDINPAALDWFDEIDTVTTKVTDYHHLFTDDSIDVIYVAVRHDLHERIYVDVIESGKDLLAEKPFGIDSGQKSSWEFEALGLNGGVRFSTKNPKLVEVFTVSDLPGIGPQQIWQHVDAGSQSVWPTVTGAIFEAGFSDSILQMWAVFLAEREGMLGDRFGAATPAEAAFTHSIYDHSIYDAAMQSHRQHAAIAPASPRPAR
jgi:hypothetical protein